MNVKYNCYHLGLDDESCSGQNTPATSGRLIASIPKVELNRNCVVLWTGDIQSTKIGI
jgi:hypothetical protein